MFLAEPLFQGDRIGGFPDFSGEAAFRADKGELRQLLRDGAAAFDNAERHDVFRQRPKNTDRIDAEMLLKPMVLDRDGCSRQPGRHVVEPDIVTLPVADPGHDQALVVEERDGGTLGAGAQILRRLEIEGLEPEIAETEQQDRHRRGDQPMG